MSKKTFKREDLLEMLGGYHPSLVEVSNVITDHGRWSVTHEVVFQEGDRYYRSIYSKGATEYQDHGPWDYGEEVECVEVQPVKKTVTVFEAVEQ